MSMKEYMFMKNSYFQNQKISIKNGIEILMLTGYLTIKKE